MDAVCTVGQLTERIKASLAGNFPYVWVRGEVTNAVHAASGHVYFALKDTAALLNCVWFAQAQRAQDHDLLTGEVFEDGPRPSLARSLTNGQEVVCAGRVGLYAPRGQCQLVVEHAQPAGQGMLAARFEALKRKLAALGYFASERKRPLPTHPTRLALITAPTGAVIRDFCTLSASRGAGAEFRLYPTPVQGAEAAPAMCAALEAINAAAWAEVIVIMRGGGSLEDLWAFNEECLAAAVFASRIPVLAAIGHEGDFTLTDMTADVRASTPSHAAPLLWPERDDLRQALDDLTQALCAAIDGQWAHCERQWERRLMALRWLSPRQVVTRQGERFARARERLARLGLGLCDKPANALEMLQLRLRHAVSGGVQKAEASLEGLRVRLKALDPLAPLQRGYALACDAKGKALRGVGELAVGEAVQVHLADGRLDTRVERITREENP